MQSDVEIEAYGAGRSSAEEAMVGLYERVSRVLCKLVVSLNRAEMSLVELESNVRQSQRKWLKKWCVPCSSD